MIEDLLPRPKEVTRLPGEGIAANSRFRLEHVLSGSEAQRLERACGRLLAPSDGAAGGVTPLRLRIDPALGRAWTRDAALAAQAYELAITADGQASITAAGYGAAVHALATLAQLDDDGPIPPLLVRDWPRCAVRGIHIDIARNVWFRMDHIQRTLIRLARLKGNVLHLYLESKFEYASCPAVRDPGSIRPDDARALSDFAADFGIEIVPHVNTLGHMERFLQRPQLAHLREKADSLFNICPTHPESRPFLLGLIRDLIEAFRPRHVHLGQDESTSGTCERCRRSGLPHEVMGEQIRWLAERTLELGAVPMIFGDRFLCLDDFPLADAVNAETREAGLRALSYVPRQVVITDWHYTTPHAGTWQFFVEKGYPTQVATATNQYWHDFIALPHDQYYVHETIDAAVAQGAVGGFHCNWEMVQCISFDNYWPLQGVAAEALWSGGEFDRQEFSRRFHRRFWGVDQTWHDELAATAAWKNNVSTLPHRRERVKDSTLHTFWAPFRQSQGGSHVYYDALGRGVSDPFFYWTARNLFDAGERAVALGRRFADAATRNRDTLDWIDLPGRLARTYGLRLMVLWEVIRALREGNPERASESLARLSDDAAQFDARLKALHETVGSGQRDRWQFLLTQHEAHLIQEQIRNAGPMDEQQIWNVLDRGVDQYKFIEPIKHLL